MKSKVELKKSLELNEDNMVIKVNNAEYDFKTLPTEANDEDIDEVFKENDSNDKENTEIDTQTLLHSYGESENITFIVKCQPPKILNALLGKDSDAREKAVRWIIKHLNDEDDDADLD